MLRLTTVIRSEKFVSRQFRHVNVKECTEFYTPTNALSYTIKY